jgi:hypothetical protein
MHYFYRRSFTGQSQPESWSIEIKMKHLCNAFLGKSLNFISNRVDENETHLYMENESFFFIKNPTQIYVIPQTDTNNFIRKNRTPI